MLSCVRFDKCQSPCFEIKTGVVGGNQGKDAGSWIILKAATALSSWSGFECDGLVWSDSCQLDREDILATIKPWQSHYVRIDCSCCVTGKTGCVHVVWTRVPLTFGHLQCSLCLLPPHYVHWALSLWGSMTLSLIGKVILLLPWLLTAKWHINDNGTEKWSHWCIFFLPGLRLTKFHFV